MTWRNTTSVTDSMGARAKKGLGMVSQKFVIILLLQISVVLESSAPFRSLLVSRPAQSERVGVIRDERRLCEFVVGGRPYLAFRAGGLVRHRQGVRVLPLLAHRQVFCIARLVVVGLQLIDAFLAFAIFLCLFQRPFRVSADVRLGSAQQAHHLSV